MPFRHSLAPIPQNDLLAMLIKCITERDPHQQKRTSLKIHGPLFLTANLRTLRKPKTRKEPTHPPTHRGHFAHSAMARPDAPTHMHYTPRQCTQAPPMTSRFAIFKHTSGGGGGVVTRKI